MRSSVQLQYRSQCFLNYYLSKFLQLLVTCDSAEAQLVQRLASGLSTDRLVGEELGVPDRHLFDNFRTQLHCSGQRQTLVEVLENKHYRILQTKRGHQDLLVHFVISTLLAKLYVSMLCFCSNISWNTNSFSLNLCQDKFILSWTSWVKFGLYF